MPSACYSLQKLRRSTKQDSELGAEESVKLQEQFSDYTLQDGPLQRQPHKGYLYIGLLSFFVASMVIIFDPIEAVMKWQGVFREGTFVFELWKKPPYKVSLKFTLFNYTNTEAFLRGEEKLNIEEIGPYVYDEFVEFNNITFHDNNTFTYIPTRTTKIDLDNTVGDSQNDIITVPNLSFLGMASFLADSSYFTNIGFNIFASYLKSEPFLTMTVEDYLIGYEDPLLEYGSKILPKAIPINKIGYLTMLADEGTNVVTISANLAAETRANGQIIEPLTIDKYNGSPGLEHYGYDEEDNTTQLHCNTLQGIASEGIVLPRKSYDTDEVAIYRKYFCRPIPFVFGNHTETSKGLPAMFFNVTKDTLYNSKPENSCFCDEDKGPCLPDGLIDLSPCFFNMPIALSAPHFLGGDPALAEAWGTIKPDQEKHNSYALIEPETGIIIKAHLRLQANLVMKNTNSNSKLKPLKNSVLPIFWVDYVLNELPEFYHTLLYIALVAGPILTKVVIATIFLAGLIFVTVYCSQYFKYKRNYRMIHY